MNRSAFQSICSHKRFGNPKAWLEIETLDMHTGGEPLRVILAGFPDLVGSNVLERRNYCKKNYDHLRTALMHEPRGHADMYGCILTPPNDQGADFGIIFLHNEGYSSMCGHATIAIAKLAVEMKWVEVKEGINEVSIDAPCGRLKAFVELKNKKVVAVSFHCVPSFVLGLDRKVNVRGLGNVIYDIAYGGAFYAYVDMAKNSFEFRLDKEFYQKLIKAGSDIKQAVINEDREIIHPYEDDLSFLYGTIFIDNRAQNSGAHSKNVCIFADGEVDRCPTGSGVSGRMAIHFARNEIKIGEEMKIESIVGSSFMGSVVEKTQYGPFDAVIPQVSGMAYITGSHKFLIDPDDPFKEGFLLR